MLGDNNQYVDCAVSIHSYHPGVSIITMWKQLVHPVHHCEVIQ